MYTGKYLLMLSGIFKFGTNITHFCIRELISHVMVLNAILFGIAVKIQGITV